MCGAGTEFSPGTGLTQLTVTPSPSTAFPQYTKPRPMLYGRGLGLLAIRSGGPQHLFSVEPVGYQVGIFSPLWYSAVLWARHGLSPSLVYMEFTFVLPATYHLPSLFLSVENGTWWGTGGSLGLLMVRSQDYLVLSWVEQLGWHKLVLFFVWDHWNVSSQKFDCSNLSIHMPCCCPSSPITFSSLLKLAPNMIPMGI